MRSEFPLNTQIHSANTYVNTRTVLSSTICYVDFGRICELRVLPLSVGFISSMVLA